MLEREGVRERERERERSKEDERDLKKMNSKEEPIPLLGELVFSGTPYYSLDEEENDS